MAKFVLDIIRLFSIYKNVIQSIINLGNDSKYKINASDLLIYFFSLLTP